MTTDDDVDSAEVWFFEELVSIFRGEYVIWFCSDDVETSQLESDEYGAAWAFVTTVWTLQLMLDVVIGESEYDVNEGTMKSPYATSSKKRVVRKNSEEPWSGVT